MIIEEFKTTSIDHYQYVSSLSELEIIDHEDVNIAIHKRNVDDNMGGWVVWMNSFKVVLHL